MEILTGDQMRRVDRRATEELGLPSLELMEAAGQGVAEALLEDYPDAATRAPLVVCGKGNNGGDGLVVARALRARGVRCRALVLAARDALAPDAAVNFRAADAAGVEIHEVADAAGWDAAAPALDASRLIIDALLGTGVRGGARGLAARAIERINASPAVVVAVDLPSGLDADNATVDGPAVRATRTYTLVRPKPPLIFDPAAALCGIWRVVPIGIPDAAVAAESPRLDWFDAGAAAGRLPRRDAASHKGSYGHLLAVAGSRGKCGAAVLLARGALRCGVGLVTIATPEPCLETIAVQQAEAMTWPLAAAAGALDATAGDAVGRLLADRDALAVGPGLGTAAGTVRAVHVLLAGGGAPRTVVDADALNALGGEAWPGTAATRASWVLTPHPGEAARLLGCTTADVQGDRVAAVQDLARRSGAVVVLKGHRTLVAEPGGRLSVNASGNPGMATGGSGDVLTGVIGALLARGLAAWDAARLGVFLHGDAGDRAARRRGHDGLIASDVVDALPAAVAAVVAEEHG